MLTGLGSIGDPPPLWLGLSSALFTVSLIVFVMLRFGLLATMTFFLVNFLLNSAPLTLDPGKWFFPTSHGDAADRRRRWRSTASTRRAAASRSSGAGCWIERSGSRN